MSDERSLIPLFMAGLPDPTRDRLAGLSRLEGVLGDILEHAQAAWPDVHVDEDIFLEYVAQKLPEEATLRSLLELKAGDLYLACACVQGDACALAVFETHFFPVIEAALMRRGPTGANLEDVKQLLCQKLLIGDRNRLPKIALYAGRGDLRSWISVTAVREAIDLMRREQRETPMDDNALVELTDPTEDQELQYLKRLYRKEFKAAFQRALGDLPRRERNVLRHHLLDGLNIDQIGALYNVHRATVARWIARSRETLLKATRKALMESLHVNRGEFESIMRLIQSRFEVSIHQYLKRSDD
jgi:RNA polymerase sigma-70 factor (ECF subfamily)